MNNDNERALNSEQWYEEQIAKQRKISDELKISLENEHKRNSELIEKINNLKEEIKRLEQRIYLYG